MRPRMVFLNGSEKAETFVPDHARIYFFKRRNFAILCHFHKQFPGAFHPPAEAKNRLPTGRNDRRETVFCIDS